MNPEETRKTIQNSTTETLLGYRTSDLGVEQNIGIPDTKRLMHTLTIGPTGSGKTQIMVHAALQDIRKGQGCCIINPKGDTLDELLRKIPEDRLDDVIYLNPATTPVPGINVLEPYLTEEMTTAQRENQKEIIVSDLIDLFRRYSENWGDRFGRILETLLRAHLDLNINEDESNTLVDIYRCVVNDDQLSQLIDKTEDPVTREELVRVKEDMGSYEMEPLQRRLNDFMENQTIRDVIASEQSGVNFQDVVNENKIVLVDIQKGEVGETVSNLVGSIIITKVWAAAQSRITQPPEQRDPFYLYVDELQNFAGEGSNFAKILSEAREYGLGCWLVTQYINQLDTSMRRAVTNNCRTKIVFDPSDAENLSQIAGMLRGLSKAELQHLGNYRAALQTPTEQQARQAVTFSTYPPWDSERDKISDIKDNASPKSTVQRQVTGQQSLGKSANAGGETHASLLKNAKEQLTENGFHVNLLYQAEGEDKPDGHVHLPDDTTAHLEAEHSTLSKPSKVLKNLERAADQDRETIFVVEPGNATKLENIVSDPVNRRGTEHEDENGSYSYYKTDDNQTVTSTEKLLNAEYRILEVAADKLDEHDAETEPECPELDTSTREELENFCLHRDEDGFCTELETTCVITHEE